MFLYVSLFFLPCLFCAFILLYHEAACEETSMSAVERTFVIHAVTLAVM